MAALCAFVAQELRRRGRAERAALENERLYRLLADNSTDLIVLADLDGGDRRLRRAGTEAARSGGAGGTRKRAALPSAGGQFHGPYRARRSRWRRSAPSSRRN